MIGSHDATAHPQWYLRHFSCVGGVALCLLTMLGASQAAAQRSPPGRAVVVDSITLAPIVGALVSLESGDGGTPAIVRRVTSDSAGAFSVPRDMGQRLRVSIQRIGYSARHLEIDVDDADSLRVAVAPLTVTVSGVRVVESAANASRALQLSGFLGRRRAGIGTFLDSTQIALQKPVDMFTLLRPYMKGCTRIFVDGLPLLPLRDVDPRRVAGIEIYASNSEAPPMFRNPAESTKRCGSIVVWVTR